MNKSTRDLRESSQSCTSREDMCHLRTSLKTSRETANNVYVMLVLFEFGE